MFWVWQVRMEDPWGTDNPIVSLGHPVMEVWWRVQHCQITYGCRHAHTQSRDLQNNQSIASQTFPCGELFNFEKETRLLHCTNMYVQIDVGGCQSIAMQFLGCPW